MVENNENKFKVTCIKRTESIKIDNKAQWIIDVLTKNGYTAYAVGGCVRDLLMNKYLKQSMEVNDTDICTSATPENVKSLFKNELGIQVLDTGIQHGTVSIVISDSKIYKATDKAGISAEWVNPNDTERTVYEVTTYRIESKYSDGRHPDNVMFSGSIEDDLIRRDFTINAMAYNRNNLVGIDTSFQDMRNGIIRCVGNPYERLSEDPLRILRAFRFQAKLGFDIENNTKEAINQLYKSLDSIQKERIHTEIIKAFSGKFIVKAVKQFESVLTYVFKPMKKGVGLDQKNPNHKYTVYEHQVKQLEAYQNYWDKKPNYMTALAIYLHDIGKPECESIDKNGIKHFYKHSTVGTEIVENMLRELKFSKHEINTIKTLVKTHDFIASNKAACKRLMAEIGEEQFLNMLVVKQCDLDAQQNFNRTVKQANIAQTYIWYNEIKETEQALSLKDLKINGSDLMKLGVPAGKEIGIILKDILELVINEEITNEKGELIKYVKNRIQQ